MEFIDLGKHCRVCNTKDFLPFKCEFCGYFFCKEHRTEHACTSANPLSQSKTHSNTANTHANTHTNTRVNTANTHANTTQPTPKKRKRLPRFKCDHENCRAREKFAIKCFKCGLNFCLKHRFQDEHNCTGYQ